MSNEIEECNETHAFSQETFSAAIKDIRETISRRGNLPYVSVERQLEIVEDLTSFPLGRFLIERRGANGFWTDYIINYPNAVKNHDPKLSVIEKFILEKCPLTLATRERFKIFQNRAQVHLKDGMTIASVPCGVMRDLLSLDFSEISSFLLLGVDLDEEILLEAAKLAYEYGLEKKCKFIQADAWKLGFESPLNLITSSGLNVYLSSKEKVRSLYHHFYTLLGHEGILITSALTYPPEEEHKSEWALELLPEEDILMEKILFQDVLGTKWRNFQSIDEIHKDFQIAGFKKVEIFHDKFRIFPTIVANKE